MQSGEKPRGDKRAAPHLLNGCHHDVLDRFLKCHYLPDLLCVEEKTTREL